MATYVHSRLAGDRNSYLSAMELRNGNQSAIAKSATGMESVLIEMTVEMILDYLAIITDTPRAQDDDLTMNLFVVDTGERFFVKRSAGVLLYYRNTTAEQADATLTCTRLQFLAILLGRKVVPGVKIEGDKTVPARLVEYVSPGNKTFNLIEP